jgi:hypothetical protein
MSIISGRGLFCPYNNCPLVYIYNLTDNRAYMGYRYTWLVKSSHIFGREMQDALRIRATHSRKGTTARPHRHQPDHYQLVVLRPHPPGDLRHHGSQGKQGAPYRTGSHGRYRRRLRPRHDLCVAESINPPQRRTWQPLPRASINLQARGNSGRVYVLEK